MTTGVATEQATGYRQQTVLETVGCSRDSGVVIVTAVSQGRKLGGQTGAWQSPGHGVARGGVGRLGHRGLGARGS